ncbi:hypothetical protein M212_4258 [Acinetobacter baumannii CI79]|nr:hypothetical protein M212_4258 [Acinetobacter baumannii CI79]KMV09200.1 hypothetical protein AB988_4352 [Acinetobacter baumannii]
MLLPVNDHFAKYFMIKKPVIKFNGTFGPTGGSKQNKGGGG